jgi:hypothetical protein
MLTNRRNTVVGAVTLVVLGTATGVGVANSTHSRTRNPTARLSHAAVRRIAANRAVLARSFPVLAKARATAAGALSLPSPFADELAAQATKPVPTGALGEPDPSLAAYVGSVITAAHGTLNVWAIPGPNDLCMAMLPTTDRGGDVECQSDGGAVGGQLSGAEEGSGGASTIIGLLPGSPASLIVHESDGAAAQVPVRNGLWVINNDRHAVSVTGAGVSGSVAIPSLP